VKKMRERDERMFEAVSELSATLTPEQRASVQRKMRGYVKDISSITASN
jgi:Spy/CpxP family protein refolding chaperone